MSLQHPVITTPGIEEPYGKSGSSSISSSRTWVEMSNAFPTPREKSVKASQLLRHIMPTGKLFTRYHGDSYFTTAIISAKLSEI